MEPSASQVKAAAVLGISSAVVNQLLKGVYRDILQAAPLLNIFTQF